MRFGSEPIHSTSSGWFFSSLLTWAYQFLLYSAHLLSSGKPHPQSWLPALTLSSQLPARQW